MKPVSLYIVEDELLITMGLKTQLEASGYSVLGMSTKCDVCLKELQELKDQGKEPEIVLMDINIRGKYDGIETARKISEKFDCGIIFVTGQSSQEVYERSIDIKPYGYLVKPIDLEQTMMIIEIGANQRRLEIQNRKYQKKLLELIDQRTKEKQELIEMYAELVDNSMVGITILQGDRFLFFNGEAKKILGFDHDEEVPPALDDIMKFIHPDDRELTISNSQRRMAGENLPQGNKIRIVRKDGSVVPLVTYVKKMQLGGKPALHHVCIDISREQ